MFELIGLFVTQVFLLAIGIALGAGCGLFVFLVSRGVADTRRRRVAILTAFCFPLIAVFYLEAGVVLHDAVRSAAGKDSILDGRFHYPLGNGYRLAFFDETAPEGAWIKDPQGASLSIGRIHGLQIAGDFLFIHADREPQSGTLPAVTVTHELPPTDTTPVDIYLELNTKTNERSDYSSFEDLDRAAVRNNTQLRPTLLDDFYGKAVSAAAPGWLFFGVLSTPVLIAGVWLLRGLHGLRSKGLTAGMD